ncbi:MAG: hypothetical protein E2O37_06965 [Proteobacteria bacterium]|nr:MAG: hypothetical protein E2O37_06965 [Pseudomonadota bacterium]
MKQKANKSAREPSAKPRKVVDWSLVKREYEVGQFSIREIARQFGVSDTTVRRKIKRFSWQRNLQQSVREGIREQLITGSRTGGRTPHARDPDADKADEQVEAERQEQIEVAVKRGVQVVREHQVFLGKVRSVAYLLADRLDRYLNNPKEFDQEIEPFMGGKPESVSDVLLRLSQSAAKFIPAERKAFNLDDESGGESYETVLMALLKSKGQM